MTGLNVTGGYLTVEVKRAAGQPIAVFRHHSVDGKILNEDVRRLK